MQNFFDIYALVPIQIKKIFLKILLKDNCKSFQFDKILKKMAMPE